MRRYSIMILLVGLATLTVRPEGFWVKKDWKEWTKNDCSKMLQDSPWAKKWSRNVVILSAASPGRSGANTSGAASENHPEVDYYIQIRSALPIRQADVRRMQIDQKYDQMDEEHKKAMDAQAEQILSPTYDDLILVHVEYSSNVPVFERQMAAHFQGVPEGSVPLNIYMINESGDHIGIIRWVSPHSGAYEFEMYFPRMIKGEPVIKPTDKKFSIEFRAPSVTSRSSATTRDAVVPIMGTELLLVDFKLDAMMWNGKVTY